MVWCRQETLTSFTKHAALSTQHLYNGTHLQCARMVGQIETGLQWWVKYERASSGSSIEDPATSGPSYCHLGLGVQHPGGWPGGRGGREPVGQVGFGADDIHLVCGAQLQVLQRGGGGEEGG